MTDSRSPEARTAYPSALREREHARWALGLPARFGNDPPPAEPQVGVALSGGGIRSATFSLGVFQAFAGRRFLKHIDFVSTISGGGYFGSFLGSLFARPYVKSPDDVASVLLESPASSSTDPGLNRARERVIPWLREHGRYLSPRGAGDQLLLLAVLFRNWFALNVVIALPFVTVALAMQLPHFWPWLEGLMRSLPPGDLVWWSPWLAAAALPFVVVPSLIWAYFLRDDHARAVVFSLAATLVVAAGVYFAPDYGIMTSRIARSAAIGLFVIVGLAIVFQRASGDDPLKSGNLLAQWLRAALGAMVVLAAAGLIDSLGQTVYFHLHHRSIGPWIAAVGAAFGGVAAFARQITVLLGPKASGDRPRLPFGILASLIAAALVLVLGTLYSATAHAIAWNFDRPAWPKLELADRNNLLSLIGWLLSLAVLTVGFSHRWRFANYSTHQPMYSARLARAYLGASNPERWKEENLSVLEPQQGDDFAMTEYWPALSAGGDERYRKGTPLHFLSVTINATVSGRSQIEQRDRKGLGFAIGPSGLSVGVRHHAVFDEAMDDAGRRLLVQEPSESTAFNALDYGQRKQQLVPFRGEPLRLGMWTGLSGAAFSTGIGSRTNLGLSIIAGFLNVRLGYWWEAHATPPKPTKSWSLVRIFGRWIGGLIQRLLPVHRYLADEFLARFPGVSRRRWYLSDGGHFENLGAYELIRRRVPLAILVDAGEDGGAMFDDLGNLVRKARTDFDAEIDFLTIDELASLKTRLGVQGDWAIGTLEDLRPECEKVENCEKEAGTERSYTRAYAALATVTFESTSPCADDGLERTLLVYVKPGLRNDEEASDLINYGRLHPAFPHESTADQFFDEAQWESYRKLGESITCRVLDDLGLDNPGRFIQLFQEEAATWKDS